MAKMGLCAIMGVFCILSSVVLILFAQISQVTPGSTVLRHIQFSTMDTTNLGPTLAAQGVDVTSLYATGPTTGDNQGLRQYYKNGLWKTCESTTPSGTSGVTCSGASFGHRFQPVQYILRDVPSTAAAAVGNLLGNSYFTETTPGNYTNAAFYLYFIGAILVGISLITSILAHRFAFLISAVAGFFAFLFFGVAATLWTVVLYKTRSALNGSGTGISVSYGNALWISWGATAAALISIVPFFLACCFGGSRRSYDDYDEKY